MSRPLILHGRRTSARAVLLAACLAAVGVTGVAAAATPAEAGHRITDKKDGFSLVTPPGWYQVVLSGSNAGSVVGTAPPNYDTFKASLVSAAQSAAKNGLKLYAVALSQANGNFLPAMNVSVFKGNGSRPVLTREIRGFLSKANAQNVNVKNVTLHFGKAVEATYELVSSSTPPVFETQVYSSRGSQIYVATFSALTQPAVELTAAVVMYSWRFTSKG